MGFYGNLRAALSLKKIRVGDWVEIMNISDYQLHSIQPNGHPRKDDKFYIGQRFKVKQVIESCDRYPMRFILDDIGDTPGWRTTFSVNQLRKV